MNTSKPPLPITLRIGYEWTDRKGEPKAFPSGVRYEFIREQIKSVVSEVSVRQLKNKRHAAFAFNVYVARMRARHGAEILPRFRELTEKTDILAFDITGHNPNVMLELGMALAIKAHQPGHIFIFKERTVDETSIPSDIGGYFITYFRADHSGPKPCRLKLEDADGFRAALGNVITDVARERGMWGQKPVDCEEADETE